MTEKDTNKVKHNCNKEYFRYAGLIKDSFNDKEAIKKQKEIYKRGFYLVGTLFRGISKK